MDIRYGWVSPTLCLTFDFLCRWKLAVDRISTKLMTYMRYCYWPHRAHDIDKKCGEFPHCSETSENGFHKLDWVVGIGKTKTKMKITYFPINELNNYCIWYMKTNRWSIISWLWFVTYQLANEVVIEFLWFSLTLFAIKTKSMNNNSYYSFVNEWTCSSHYSIIHLRNHMNT